MAHSNLEQYVGKLQRSMRGWFSPEQRAWNINNKELWVVFMAVLLVRDTLVGWSADPTI